MPCTLFAIIACVKSVCDLVELCLLDGSGTGASAGSAEEHSSTVLLQVMLQEVRAYPHEVLSKGKHVR